MASNKDSGTDSIQEKDPVNNGESDNESMSSTKAVWGSPVRKERETSYVCEICRKHFKTKAQYYQHVFFNHVDCKNHSSCNDSDNESMSSTKAVCGSSVKKKTKPTCPYICSFCREVFKSKNLLDQHKAIHLAHRPLTCKVCGMNFKSGVALAFHLESHLDKIPRKCYVCGQMFKNLQIMKLHYTRHSNAYKCRVCKRLFKSEKSLKSHRRIDHMSMNDSTGGTNA